MFGGENNLQNHIWELRGLLERGGENRKIIYRIVYVKTFGGNLDRGRRKSPLQNHTYIDWDITWTGKSQK